MPFLSCYGLDGERRYRPDGMFSLRKTFTTRPSGALPYVLFTIGLSAVAAWAGSILAGGQPSVLDLVAITCYAAGFWTFFWSCGRLASSFLLGLRASRVLQFILFLGVVGVPLPIIAIGDALGQNPWLAYISILAPLFKGDPAFGELAGYGIFLALAGLFVAWRSEHVLRRRLARKGKSLADISRATGAMPG